MIQESLCIAHQLPSIIGKLCCASLCNYFFLYEL